MNKNFSIELDYDERIPVYVNYDEKSLKHILINLLSNAYKFTNNGYIKLTVRKIENKLYIEVSDTGSGILNEEQEKIFDPFYVAASNQDRNIDGSGLGLYIVKEFVEKLGSKLNFQSEYGKGSKFFFELNLEVDIETSINNETMYYNAYYPILRQSAKDLHYLNGILVLNIVKYNEFMSETVLDNWISGSDTRKGVPNLAISKVR
jgi:hypothetical protein